MLRIQPISPDQAPEEVRAVYDQLKKTKWRVPTMYQTLAHHPRILMVHEAYFNAVMNEGVLSRNLKEKLAYKVAMLNGCAYSSASHYRYALKTGATSEEMKAIDEMQTLSMTPAEVAALQLAEAMNKSGKQVTTELFDELRRHYSSSEVIELLATVGLMVLACRMADALGLEPDQ